MADIRINALATTAASTASDDFLAVDGSSQGTRKLNAYSPTFGGNLTLSGATSTITLGSTNTATIAGDASGGMTITPKAGQSVGLSGSTTISAPSNTQLYLNAATGQRYTSQYWRNNDVSKAYAYWDNDNNIFAIGALNTNGSVYLYPNGTGTVQVVGNLTVSGTGESTFSGTIVPAANISKNFGKTTSAWLAIYAKYLQQNDASGYLTSNTDGSIALNSQSNQNITLTPHGTGIVSIATNLTVSGGTISSGSGTLTLKSTANTVVLQSAGTTALTLDSSQNATFAGSIAINNTVQTAVAVASTHKVTISIGGSTYYLLATNV